jgi:hypothetical protein
MGILEYNRGKAEQYGWDPSWFGCASFDQILIDEIKKYQSSMGLKADGMCGEGTFRRIYNERTSDLADAATPKGKDVILCNGNAVPIEWGKVVHWTDKGGLSAKEGCYRKHSGVRDVDLFVNHWDVCLSSTRCQSVLDKRGISVHFLLDNDGTIYQTMDTNDIAWHAGGRDWNNRSIGIEISNAYYTKWQGWYESRNHGSRPIIKGAKVHGSTLEDHLGFYPVQLDALKALWKAVSVGHNIPLKTPLRASTGGELGAVHIPSQKGSFRGIVHHYNLTARKIDCGGMDIAKMLGEM